MLDSLFRKATDLSLARLAGEYKEDFIRETSFVNLNRERIFAFILVIIQIPLICLDLQNRRRGIWEAVPGYRHLFSLHIAIGIVFSAYWIASWFNRPASPALIGRRHRFLETAFPAAGLLLSAAVSAVDQMIHGQITVYLIGSFWVAVSLYLGNVAGLLAYFAAYALFMIGVYAFQHDPDALIGHYINGSVLIVLAYALSRALYVARVREFVRGRIIRRQNETIRELEEKRHLIEEKRLQEAVRKTIESLAESEDKFRTLAETTTAAIFIHDGGMFQYVNPAVEQMTGYAREEFLNMDFWKIIHPDHQELVRERARSRLQGATVPSQYEFKVIKKDGETRWGYMTAGLIAYQGKPAVIGTLFDITDRKRAEEEKARLYEENVRQYQARLEEERRHQREKEAILKDLHDGIGGMMTNVSLLSELARKESSLPAARKMLSTISELSREALSELRSFMNSLDDKETDWHDFIADLRRFGSTMVGPHGMAFDITASVHGSPEQPRSLLCLNLFRIYKEALSNIVKHSKANAVAVAMNVGPERLALSISDDGVGLGKEQGAGRGLSNMIARSEEIGGRLTVTSDKGTRVLLDLPLPRKYPGEKVDSGQP